MDKNSTDKGQQIARMVLVAGLLLLGAWIAGRFLPALLWGVILAVAIDPLHLKLRARFGGAHRIAIPLAITTAAALVVLVPLALGIAPAAREAHAIGPGSAPGQAARG